MDLWYQKQPLSQLPNQKYFALTKDIVLFLINNIERFGFYGPIVKNNEVYFSLLD